MTVRTVRQWVRRTPHGVRGLKLCKYNELQFCARRTPHGVRGLKSSPPAFAGEISKSHPAWGAWIEIANNAPFYRVDKVAPRMGCVD